MKKKWKQITVLAAILLMLLTALPATTYAASKPVPSKVTLNKISAPAYNKITIRWKKASNATSYNVYYKKKNASKYTKIASVSASKTSYTHTASTKYPIIVGQEYTYTVRAYNKTSKKYGSYNKTGLTTKTIPETVKLEKAVLNSDNSVTISWNKASGCDYYAIYQTTPLQQNKWNHLTTIKANTLTYTDTHPYLGVENKYTVRGYYTGRNVYGKYDTKGVSVWVPDSDDEEWSDEDDEPDVIPIANPEEMAREVIRLTNLERAKAGKAPLTYNAALQKGAMVRAKELVTLFSHIRPDGRDSRTAVWEAGGGHCDLENIAGGFKNPEAVVQGWMNSPGHKAAMLNPTATHIGVGIYQDTDGYIFWIQEFASGDPDEKVTITFDPNGGTGNYSLTVPWGQTVYMKDIPVPTREGYTFGGWLWYNSVVKGGAVTKNVTLYAKWE